MSNAKVSKLSTVLRNQFGQDVAIAWKKWTEEEEYDDEALDDEWNTISNDGIPESSIIEAFGDFDNAEAIVQYLFDNRSSLEQSEEKKSGEIKEILLSKIPSVKAKAVQEMKERILKVCRSLHHEKDESLFTTLAIGYAYDKNHSLLQLMADCYMRYIADCKTGNEEKCLPPEEWAIQLLKPLIAQGRSSDASALKHGLTSYFKRMNTPNSFNPATRIDDNFVQIVYVVVGMMKFILAKASSYPLPLQFDLWILPKNAVFAQSDSPADEEYDYEGADEEDAKSERPFASIAQELDQWNKSAKKAQQKMHFVASKLKEPKQAERHFGNEFNRLLNESQIHNDQCGRRYVAVYDRKFADDANRDNFYLMTPPSEYAKLPQGFIPESFSHLSNAFVFPNNASASANASSEGEQHFGVKNDCAGYMFCLSFHVASQNNVKCYLYQNSSVSRVFTQDIVELWPKLFSNEADYKKGSNEALEHCIKQLHGKLKDDCFDLFLKNHQLK